MNMIDQGDDVQAQKEFERKYITSTEICDRLHVSRVAVHLRRKAKKLPGAITIQPALLTIWEREQVEPYLQSWETHLEKRRSAVA